MKFTSALLLAATAVFASAAPLERRADFCGDWDNVKNGPYTTYNNLVSLFQHSLIQYLLTNRTVGQIYFRSLRLAVHWRRQLQQQHYFMAHLVVLVRRSVPGQVLRQCRCRHHLQAAQCYQQHQQHLALGLHR